MRMAVLKEALCFTLDAGLTPFVVGQPGLGKSSAVYQAAEKRGKPVKTWSVFRPGIEDPTDGKGIPVPAGDHHVWLPGECVARLQRGEDMGNVTVLVDDAPQGVAMTVNGFAPLAQREPDGTRRIGPHVIPANVDVVFTGNRKEDKSSTHELGAFMKDRLVYLQLDFHYQDLEDEMKRKEWDPKIIAFLNRNPNLGQAFDPSKDKSPTCRGWNKMSDLEKLNPPQAMVNVIAPGIIGTGAAAQYMETRKLMDKLPNLNTIARTGVGTIPDEASLQYCLVVSITRMMNDKNVSNFMKYLEGFPQEMMEVIKGDIARDTERCSLLASPAWTKWLASHGKKA